MRCLPLQTGFNLDKSPNQGLQEDTNKDRRVQGPQIEAREMFLSLTNHSSAVSRVILLSCPLDRWVVVNLRELTHMHTHSQITRRPESACGCLSAHVRLNECVGTPRCSGGRMPFPHPSLPIISCPDKTPVCWRLQDQTVMSRHLSSQHTADARWLSLS